MRYVKWTILAVLALIVFGFLHYITKGPNDVSKELEDEMDRKDREAEALEKENLP